MLAAAAVQGPKAAVLAGLNSSKSCRVAVLGWEEVECILAGQITPEIQAGLMLGILCKALYMLCSASGMPACMCR
jgi:hypothetical protein